MGQYFQIEMRLKLLMSFAYCYDYPIEIFVACTVERKVSRDDERYLFAFRASYIYSLSIEAGDEGMVNSLSN